MLRFRKGHPLQAALKFFAGRHEVCKLGNLCLQWRIHSATWAAQDLRDQELCVLSTFTTRRVAFSMLGEDFFEKAEASLPELDCTSEMQELVNLVLTCLLKC